VRKKTNTSPALATANAVSGHAATTGSIAHGLGAPHTIAGMSALALLGGMGVYLGRAGLRELD